MEAEESTEALQRKYQIVAEWLKETFRTQIPPFEINFETVGYLYELAVANKRRNKELGILIDDHMRKAKEYKAEDFDKGSLNNAISTLSSLAVQLEIKEPNLSRFELLFNFIKSYYLGINDWMNEKAEMEKELRELQKKQEEMSNKTHKWLNHLTEWQKAERESTQNEAEAQSLTMERSMEMREYFHPKAEEYQQTFAHLESVLEGNGCTPQFLSEASHRALVQLSQSLQLLRQQTAPKVNALKSYHSLPPDLALARVKVEGARKELLELEEQLQASITQFL